MNSKTELKVVIGLGKTGLSCVNYLMQQNLNVAVVDSRVNPPGLTELQQKYPQIPVFLGDFNAECLQHASELIVSPGVSLREPPIAAAIKHGISAIGDIELFAREVKVPVVAVTGSNGKSTVTTLVGEMAKTAGIKVKVGGNLGDPALHLLDNQTELYVLELSSFQLETTYSLQPAAAVVLNISEDHMDRYVSLDEYTAAKKRIYNNCKVAIINLDDPLSYSGVVLPEHVISFGLSEVADFGLAKDKTLIFPKKHVKNISFKINDLKTKGLHQVANALASLALGTAIDLPLEAMLQALREFPGLAHRCQWVRTLNGVEWYNDSKATNVGATKAAIEGLGTDIKGKVVLIAGGQGKDADFTPLRATVAQYVRTMILIGQDAAKLNTALNGTTETVFANSMQQAVELAAKYAQSADAVLLAPACASFDMFKNFEHRGEMFTQEVMKL